MRRLNAIKKTDDNIHPEVFKIALYKHGVTKTEFYDYLEMPPESWPDILKMLESL